MFDRFLARSYRWLGCAFWLWALVFSLSVSSALAWSLWGWALSPAVCIL